MFKGFAKDMLEQGVENMKQGNDDSAQEAQATPPPPPPEPAYQQPKAQKVAPRYSTDYSREEVTDIQLRLEILGYNPGPPDGVFGGKTSRAIARFEIDNGMRVTGQPSPALLVALETMTATAAGMSTIEKAPQPPAPHYPRNQLETHSAQQEHSSVQGAYALAKTEDDCWSIYSNDQNTEQYMACMKRVKQPASVSDTDIVAEARDYEASCRQSSVQSQLYDCQCMVQRYIGERFDDRSSAKEEVQARVAEQCVNPDGAFGYVYDQCAALISTDMSLWTPEQDTPDKRRALCECFASSFADRYSAEPGMDSGYIQRVRLESQVSCY
ncbi:peptidoglycan-binding domain-containing protein [Marinobacterium sp. YM272]|uniref:peptidoglycan-binding domain-containing protein n=1 Tax=Marinobacterium sp. YM272 TaxID=3421654 RepID=UPI003D7F7B6D